jgi:hypothetical protein
MKTFTQLLCLLGLFATTTAGLSTSPPPTLTRVLVTGAAGRTGQLVFGALLEDSRYEARALVRSEKSGKKLRKVVPATGLNQIIVCDATTLGEEPTTPAGLDGFNAMLICTSAVPIPSKRSLVNAYLKMPLNVIRRKKAFDFKSLSFVFKKGQYPEKVDYQGLIAQIDLAKKLDMKHVVLVGGGSMRGSDTTNFINTIGKNADGSGNGDILLWKRKAERYLVDSGLDYTIIHPGGLLDTPPGQEQYVLGVDAKSIVDKKRSISRGDVADLCIAALTVGKGKKVVLDCITRVPEEGAKVKSAEEALKSFFC